MTHSLIRDLSRSPDADLRRVGEALAPLSPSGGRPASGPRASEALAEFLAVPQTSTGAAPEIAGPPVPDLVIELGQPVTAPRRGARLLGRGVFAKAVLGATVVLAVGAGLATVAGPLGHDTVVITPTTPTTSSTATAPPGLLTDGHEGRAHAGDGDDPVRPRRHRGTTGPTAPVPPEATEDRGTGSETGERSEPGPGEDATRTEGGGEPGEDARDGAASYSEDLGADQRTSDVEPDDVESSGTGVVTKLDDGGGVEADD